MDFAFTPDQLAIREAIDRICANFGAICPTSVSA